MAFRIDHAQLSLAELKKIPAVEAALTKNCVSGDGIIGIDDATLYFKNELKRGSGWISFSGLEARGLSANRITKQKNSPLLAFVDYNLERQPYALQLREIQLATVRGELDWALTSESAFGIRVRGDLLPGALDEVLGVMVDGSVEPTANSGRTGCVRGCKRSTQPTPSHHQWRGALG